MYLIGGWTRMFETFTWPPDPYILALTGAGLLIALVAWLPLVLKRLPLSLPIVCIAIGAALFWLLPIPIVPSPTQHGDFVERFTEFVVIIALVGAGLKLDRVFSWGRWAVTWRHPDITAPGRFFRKLSRSPS